jgi:hypothetical protein
MFCANQNEELDAMMLWDVKKAIESIESTDGFKQDWILEFRLGRPMHLRFTRY